MIDGKKALMISTLVVGVLVLIWGTYTFFSSGVLSPNTTKDSSYNSSNNNSSSTNGKETQKDNTKDDEDSKSDEDDKKTDDKDAGKETDKTNNSSNKDKDTVSTDVEFVEYVVKSGDTLSSIFRDSIKGYSFADAVKLIADKNSLENANNLKPGQKLLIPTAKDSSENKYIIKQGDTLTKLAKKYFPKEKLLDAIKAIMQENDIEDENSIEVGQVIIIPEAEEN